MYITNYVHQNLLTLLHLINCRRNLFLAVHNFVHLNLAIALFAGYLIFAVGVELGAKNKVQGLY